MSFDVELGRDVELIGDIFPVFLALPDALSEQVFDLSVHRAEVVLGPGGDGLLVLGRQAQRDLFFLLLSHGNQYRLPALTIGCAS